MAEPDPFTFTPVNYDPFERAAQRVRAPYDKANQRVSGLPDVLDVIGNRVKSGLTAPMDTLTGELQVNDPETNMPTQQAMGRAGDVAGLATVSGMPAAERGALGMAGGKLKRLDVPIKPSSDDVYELASSNFTHGLPIGNKTISIKELKNNVSSDPVEQARVDKLAEAIKSENGYFSRPVIDTEGNVIEGQHRVEALKKLGIDQVPVSMIKDLTKGYDLDAMRNAIKGLHGDQKHNLIQNALEAIHESGSPEAALSSYEMPAQFQKPWEDVLNAALGSAGGKMAATNNPYNMTPIEGDPFK